MNHFYKTLKRLALVCASVLALGGGALHAEPYFIHKDGAMVLDKATGLVWMRCALGQFWDRATCAGGKKLFTAVKNAQQEIKQLNAAGGSMRFNDWTMPTIRQLASLRYCSMGFSSEVVDIKDGDEPLPKACNAGSSTPAFNATVMPNADNNAYFTSSVYAADSVWGLFAKNGQIVSQFRDHSYNEDVTFLVRALGQQSAEQTDEFITLEAHQEKMRKERNVELQRQDAERQRQESEQKSAATARAAAQRKLIASGAQSLYLQAGKAQRSGSIDVNGVSFSADELYELVVEKFPKSEYAVKASDQLNAMSRSD
jgi:Protein of unknown function (DUF1566)